MRLAKVLLRAWSLETLGVQRYSRWMAGETELGGAGGGEVTATRLLLP